MGESLPRSPVQTERSKTWPYNKSFTLNSSSQARTQLWNYVKLTGMAKRLSI